MCRDRFSLRFEVIRAISLGRQSMFVGGAPHLASARGMVLMTMASRTAPPSSCGRRWCQRDAVENGYSTRATTIRGD